MDCCHRLTKNPFKNSCSGQIDLPKLICFFSKLKLLILRHWWQLWMKSTVNTPYCQNRHSPPQQNKIWEAKFSPGRRSQDSEESGPERCRRGGGREKIYYGPRRRARNLSKEGKNTRKRILNRYLEPPGSSRLMINSPGAPKAVRKFRTADFVTCFGNENNSLL